MLDYVIVSSIHSAIRENTRPSMGDVTLFGLYVVVVIAAIVTAAIRAQAGTGDVAGVVLATTAPCVYLALLPFGTLTPH
mgnify:CR=1 FL=1